MNLNPCKYIIFLSTDGAGTHILRSIFMDLAKFGLAEPIDHNEFLPKASACLHDPDGHLFDEHSSNKEVFKNLCQSMELPLPTKELDREQVYYLFEAAYSKSKLVLDFTRSRYTTVRTDRTWTQDDIDALRALVLGYIDRPNRTIELLFFQQTRNPLDHLASLHERFSHMGDIDTWKAVITSYLENLDIYKEELTKRRYQKYMAVRLDDIVANFKSFYSEFCNWSGISADLDYYTSKLSLNKWLSCPYVYGSLDDTNFIGLARKYGYEFRILPPRLRWINQIEGVIMRNCLELKVIFDTASGKVNENNPINTKHQLKGYFPRIVNRLLRILGFNCPSTHRRLFHNNLRRPPET